MHYATFPSSFNPFTIVWEGSGSKIQIFRIYLSDFKVKSEVKALNEHKQIVRGKSSSVSSLGKNIQKFLEGENMYFNLDMLDFSRCSEIQKKVILAEYHIPRGWVSTYKRIAIKVGIQNGARVVGNSLAKNPFPIIIPCHRAIRSDGHLGGFQGGIRMKRTLLKLEGIQFLENGKVSTDKIYY